MENLLLQKEGIVPFCKQLGIPDKLITNEILAFYFPSCFAEVFTYGEITTHHGPLPDRLRVEWFGEQHFGQGRFVRELAAFRDGKRKIRNADTDAIQDALASLFAASMTGNLGNKVPFPPFDPSIVPSPIRVQGSTVFFGGHYDQKEYSERVQRPIKNILALEPGIRGFHLIDRQLQLYSTDPAALYTYTTISTHSYMANLLNYYFSMSCRQLSGDGSLKQALDKQETYLSFQGNIATVTQQMINANYQDKQPIEAMDLVTYTSYLPPTITPSDAQKVLKNAYQMLRPGGALLLGFPAMNSERGNVSGKDLIGMAFKAGFVEDKSRGYIDTSNMLNARVPIFVFFLK